MAAARTLEDKLNALDLARKNPTGAEEAALFAKALQSKQSVLVQRAADILRLAEIRDYDEALCEAFPRFLENPLKTDKGCLAKQAIVEALVNSDSRADRVFLAGIRHFQPEPVWGGKEDTAVDLRVSCALGLANTQHPDLLRELTDLLADPEPMARVGAARALDHAGRVHEGALLLRLRCRVGDEDPRVMQATFTALLSLEADESLPFVASYLRAGNHEHIESAALALGECRNGAAFLPLREALEDTIDSELRPCLATAIAMLRSQEAWGYLLLTIAEESEGLARAALTALAYFRHEPNLAERVHTAVEESANPILRELEGNLFS